ncbi:hypothetical protein KY290_029559 [Solanum tuberosum]|uniref:Uncharacterized protein n=1 Tax=Solanum tuberosum TaxID=4113 RepID=A0ABQ7UL49_SOLTU|nr:hypothetical protein KY290_029559 [Solanum tuberosum]
MVGREVTVELKNDLAIRGTLHSVDQYLNIKLENTSVVDEDKYPHMRSVRNCFIRGSVVRYVQLPPDGVDIELLHDAMRREARGDKLEKSLVLCLLYQVILMEHSPDDPVCVIKVEVNCCTACQRKLRKILLKINGVLEVCYDPRTNLATIRGNFNPLMLIEAIKKKGKKAELISYSKNPLSHDNNSTSRNSSHNHFDNKEEAAACHTKDYKGKAKVGDDNKKRNEHCWNSSDDETCDDQYCEDYVSPKNKKCEDFVSTKNKQKYHTAEAYVAPQGVDPSICRDRYCKIHRRGGGMRDYVTREERQKKYAMFMQMGGHPAGFFNGEAATYMLPPYQYGHYGPDLDYGFYPPPQPMSGLNDFTRYFGDQDSRTCTIM